MARWWRKLTACAPWWCAPREPSRGERRRGAAAMLDSAMNAPGEHQWLPPHQHQMARSVTMPRRTR